MNVTKRNEILNLLIEKKILGIDCDAVNCITIRVEGLAPIQLEAECWSSSIGLYGINATQLIESKNG
jgi:hypothetical protein